MSLPKKNDVSARRFRAGGRIGFSASRKKNKAAIILLDEWFADESGYDESTWERIRKSIDDNRLSERKRFCD